MILVLLPLLIFGSISHVLADVAQANGIKIGEVDQQSALIWLRLTKHPQANHSGAMFIKPPKGKKADISTQLPPGKTLDEMQGAVPGAPGSVRLSWRNEGSEPVYSQWTAVDPEKDFTHQYRITGLRPGRSYSLKVESRDSEGKAGQSIQGSFRTPPPKEQEAPISFVVVSCQDYHRRDSEAGHQIYPSMQALDPDFFVHTGDIEYYDKPEPFATNLQLARFKWNRLYGLSNLSNFSSNIASYFMKDDHDTTMNDSWPGVHYYDLSWKEGLDLFREQFPVKSPNYRTLRWGKDLQVWLVEGRDFRSPNPSPDGPEKTIWGESQKEWFFRTFKESNATFRILISPTPIVGPDRGSKSDNHANAGFAHEGNQIRSFMASQKNAFIICGDRHWQYVSIDNTTGVKEFSCGPTSNAHAGGWNQSTRLPEHQYLNVKGGFLWVTVSRPNGIPTLKASHCGVTGEIYNEDISTAKE